MSTQAPSGVDEVHILSTSEGMSCDGDSVSVTTAMLPSIEEVVLGAIPGLPKVHLHINDEGYGSSMGNNPVIGESLTPSWWIDLLAHKAWGVVAIGTCATYGGIHAMAGNPTGCMGLAYYLGPAVRSSPTTSRRR